MPKEDEPRSQVDDKERLESFTHVFSLHAMLTDIVQTPLPNHHRSAADGWKVSCELYGALGDPGFRRKHAIVPGQTVFGVGDHDGSLILESYERVPYLIGTGRRSNVIRPPIEAFVEQHVLDQPQSDRLTADWIKLYMAVLAERYYRVLLEGNNGDKNFLDTFSPSFPTTEQPLRLLFAQRKTISALFGADVSWWVQSGPCWLIATDSFAPGKLDNLFALQGHIEHELLLHTISQLGDPARARGILNARLPLVEVDFVSGRQYGFEQLTGFVYIGIAQDMLKIQATSQAFRLLENIIHAETPTIPDSNTGGNNYFYQNEIFAAFFSWVWQNAENQSPTFFYAPQQTKKGYKSFLVALCDNADPNEWFAANGWPRFKELWQQDGNAKRFLLTSLVNKISLVQLATLLRLPVPNDVLHDSAATQALLDDIRTYYAGQNLAEYLFPQYSHFTGEGLVNAAKNSAVYQFNYVDSCDENAYHLTQHALALANLPALEIKALEPRLAFIRGTPHFAHAVGINASAAETNDLAFFRYPKRPKRQKNTHPSG